LDVAGRITKAGRFEVASLQLRRRETYEFVILSEERSDESRDPYLLKFSLRGRNASERDLFSS